MTDKNENVDSKLKLEEVSTDTPAPDNSVDIDNMKDENEMNKEDENPPTVDPKSENVKANMNGTVSPILQIDTTDILDDIHAGDAKVTEAKETPSEVVKVEEVVEDGQTEAVEGETPVSESPKDEEKLVEKKETPPAVESSGKEVKSKDNPKCLWISNISRECKASDLKMHLSKFGRVTTAKIVTDGKLFYGYAIMEKPEDVNVCIKNFDGTYFEGKKIAVSNKGPDSMREPAKKCNSETKSISGKSSRSKSEAKRQPTPKLQNKSPKSRRNRSDMVREMELLKRRMIEEERGREQRRREERNREREREERRRLDLEFKLREARKKLDQEREAFEREKIALIKLQKMVAEEERNKLKREKDNLKKEYKTLEAGLKRRKDDDFDRKNKVARVERGQERRKVGGMSYKEDSWRFDEKKVSGRMQKPNEDFKYKREFFSPKSGKPGEEKIFRVAPPPPKLSDDFEYGRSMKGEMENNYRKVDYMDRRDERKPQYDHREKKMNDKPGVRYQGDYGERAPQERKMPKYPSTIGGFPNGKPDFMEPKHYIKHDAARGGGSFSQVDFHGNKSNWNKSMGPPSGMYVDHWKNESNVCSMPRYHGQPFSGPNYGIQNNNPDYYQPENRYDYHGRKY